MARPLTGVLFATATEHAPHDSTDDPSNKGADYACHKPKGSVPAESRESKLSHYPVWFETQIKSYEHVHELTQPIRICFLAIVMSRCEIKMANTRTIGESCGRLEERRQ